MNYYLIILIAVALVACSEGNQTEDSSEKATDLSAEYAVINQTFPQIPERLSLFDYREIGFYHEDEFVDSLYGEKWSETEREFINNYLGQNNIDTADICKLCIEIIRVDSKMKGTGEIRDTIVDLDYLNHPDYAILIGKDIIIDENSDKFYPYVTFSRVFFNQDSTEAEYHYGVTYGPMNGHGVHIKAELRNGAWFIVKKKGTWIS